MVGPAKLSPNTILSNIRNKTFTTEDIRQAVFTKKRSFTSAAWSRYLAIYDANHSLIESHVQCKVCRGIFKSGIEDGQGTSNLLRHMRKCSAMSKAKEQETQPKISGFQSVLSDVHKRLMLFACVAFVVLDLRPIFAIEGEGLRQLLHAFAIITTTYVQNIGDIDAMSYFLPSRDTVRNHIVGAASKIQVKLKQLMEPVFGDTGWGGAISFDIWTDEYLQNSYIGINAHFVDENFKLHNRVIGNVILANNRSKSGEYILRKVRKRLRKLGINLDKVVFVTDRGSNVIAALKDYQHIACALHFINNCLQNCFKSGRPAEILVICRKIIRYIKKSGQNTLFEPTLKSPSNVRWNYAHQMLSSLVAGDNWDVLEQTLRGTEKQKLFDKLNKNEVIELISFLNIFNRATKSMETTSTPTLHNVLAWYSAIERHLQFSGQESEIVKAAKANIESYFLLTKMENDELLTSIHHKMSIYLHPAMKQMPKFSNDERALVRGEVSYLF